MSRPSGFSSGPLKSRQSKVNRLAFFMRVILWIKIIVVGIASAVIFTFAALLIGEFLALALLVLFGLSLAEPLVLGDAHVRVSPLWILMARSKPLLFFIIGGIGLGLFILLELLRHWLRRRWATDLYIAENFWS